VAVTGLPVANAGIYRIVHRESGKSYVGSSINVETRWRKHRETINAGTNQNPHLRNAVRKYGWEAFDFVIEEHCVPDRAYLLEREQVYLDAAALDKGAFYNIAMMASAPPAPSGDDHWSRKNPERVTRGDTHWTHTNPEKVPRGDKAWSHLHPERLARGDTSGSHLHPESRARGDTHGTRTKPWRFPRGDQSWSHRHPELRARGEKHGSRTHPERVARGDRHGSVTHPESRPRGEQNNQAKLTEATVREIRSTYAAGGVTQKELAERFGVSRESVWNILNGKTWSHVGA